MHPFQDATPHDDARKLALKQVAMLLGDVTASIGRTPLVELRRMATGLPGRVAAKLEMRNPCGSVKDRVGVVLIEDAERRGVLQPGMT